MHGFSAFLSLRRHIYRLCAPCERRAVRDRNPEAGGKPMTRDELNRELRMHSASWQAVLIVYGAIIGTFVLSAMAVL
jgi:hypothetical protein